MATTLKDVTDSALDLGRDVKDSAEQFGRAASGKIDTAREQASGALRDAAASVRKGSARIDVMAGSAASRLDAAATAVKDADMKSVSAGVRRFGQNNLGATVAFAVAFGFLVGSAFRRSNKAA